MAATAAPFLRRRSRFRATCALIALGEGEPTRVLAHGAKKRCPDAGLVGIGVSISHFLLRKRWGEVLEKESVPTEIRVDWWCSSSTCDFKGRALYPGCCLLPSGRIPDFAGGNPLGERIVSWGINHESAFVPQSRDYGATGGHE